MWQQSHPWSSLPSHASPPSLFILCLTTATLERRWMEHCSGWLLCWALGGKINGNKKNVLLFTEWKTRLPLSWTGTAQPSSGFPPAVAAANKPSLCLCSLSYYIYLTLMHCRFSLWAYWALFLSVHSHKSGRRRTGLHLVLPAHHGITPAISSAPLQMTPSPHQLGREPKEKKQTFCIKIKAV